MRPELAALGCALFLLGACGPVAREGEPSSGPGGNGDSAKCAAGEQLCNGACRSESVDACGSTCAACEAPANATATCENSRCTFQCQSTHLPCDRRCATPGELFRIQSLDSFPGLRLLPADFNHDGRMDLIVLSDTFAARLEVMLQKSDGSFAPGFRPDHEEATDAAAADFDLDGQVDLAVSVSGWFGTEYKQAIQLFWGKGDGTFAAPVFFDNLGSTANGTRQGLVAGDFDGDNRPELVSTTDGWLRIHQPQTGRSFSTSTRRILPGTSVARASDVNDDGLTDLVILFGGQHLEVNLGTQSRVPSEGAITRFEGPVSGSVELADVNEDGKRDLIYDVLGEVRVRLGNGDGTFGEQQSPKVYGDLPKVLDVNGDGHLDILTRTDLSQGLQIRFYFGVGTGAFTKGPTLVQDTFVAGDWLAADVNRDGHDDLVALFDGLSVFYSTAVCQRR